jgi:hypothetical protein
MRKFNEGDLFWAIHRKNDKEEIGIAHKRTYGFEFKNLHRIHEGLKFVHAYEYNLIPIEDEIHEDVKSDLIDFVLDMKDKEWFMELVNTKQQA